MYVRTIGSSILAVALMATTGGVYAAPKFDQITVLGMTLSVPHIPLATTDTVYAPQNVEEITVLGMTLSVARIELAKFDQITVLGMTLSVPHIALATTDEITVLGESESESYVASSKKRR